MAEIKTNWVKPKVKRQSKLVDVSSLVIVNDPIPDTRATVTAKYGELFAKLKFGQAIKCGPDEAGKIGHALNTWLQKNKKPGMAKTCRRYEADGMGRVWLVEPQKTGGRK